MLRLKTPPPADFEASLSFTIRGGQKWKSVGIVFDSARRVRRASRRPVRALFADARRGRVGAFEESRFVLRGSQPRPERESPPPRRAL